MKKLILIAIIFLVGCAAGTMTMLTEEEKNIETVIEVPGYSKEMIYYSSRMWLAEIFMSEQTVIEYENIESGTIIGNGVIPYPCDGLECVVRGNWNVPFTLKIEAQADMFSTTFSNIRLSMPSSGSVDSGIYNPGGIAPVWRKADMDVIKPVLLTLNRQLTVFLVNNRTKND